MDEKTLYQIGAKLVADGVNVEDSDAVRDALTNCVVPTLHNMISKADLRRSVYSGLPVYLDGKLAQIVGFANDVATVRNVFVSYDWSWSAVARIVAAGGHFKS
jgi:hypothetical protein